MKNDCMVLDIKELHEWRYIDKKGEQVLPWYTRPALDVLLLLMENTGTNAQ